MQIVKILREAATPAVAHVDGSRRRLDTGEESPLRAEVVLHRPVEIEVVLTQVRKHERIEAHALEPLESGPMGRRLERDTEVSGVEHLPEESLEIDRFRSREGSRTLLATDSPLDRADEPRACDPQRPGSNGEGMPSWSFRSSR